MQAVGVEQTLGRHDGLDAPGASSAGSALASSIESTQMAPTAWCSAEHTGSATSGGVTQTILLPAEAASSSQGSTHSVR